MHKDYKLPSSLLLFNIKEKKERQGNEKKIYRKGRAEHYIYTLKEYIIKKTNEKKS